MRTVLMAMAVCVIAMAMPVRKPAHAFDDHDWVLGDSYSRRAAPRHRHRAPVKRYRVPERDVSFYRPAERLVEQEDMRECKRPVRGLGTQWIGTEGALEAAKKDWMERTRYDFGETYVDMGHSMDFISRCGRVSIGEVAGQVTYRCEIIATPCKGVFKEGAGLTKGVQVAPGQ